MSTKLYYGFRLPAGADPFAFADLVRREAGPVRDMLDARLIARRAAVRIDDAHVGTAEAPAGASQRDAISWAYWAILDEQMGMRRDGKTEELGYDPHSLTVALGRDPRTGRILGYPLADHNDLRDAVLGLPGVEEYGYWNNTDRPEGVTSRQWRARERAWRRVLPGASTFDEAMLTIELRSAYHVLARELRRPEGGGVHRLVRQGIPSRSERGARLLVDALWRRRDHTGDAYSTWIAFIDLRHLVAPYAERAGTLVAELTDEALLAPLGEHTTDDALVSAIAELADEVEQARDEDPDAGSS